MDPSTQSKSASPSPILGAIKQLFSSSSPKQQYRLSSKDPIKSKPKQMVNKQANARKFGKIKNNSMVTLDLQNNHVTYHDDK